MTTDFNFVEWSKMREQQRVDRKIELREALAHGLAVWHGGSVWSTAGVISPAGRFHSTSVHAHAVFIEPYQSDPAYLAEHIESREHGFGFETRIIRCA